MSKPRLSAELKAHMPAGCYVAAKQKVKMESILMKYGLLSGEHVFVGSRLKQAWVLSRCHMVCCTAVVSLQLN